jgi:hypothetical protein
MNRLDRLYHTTAIHKSAILNLAVSNGGGRQRAHDEPLALWVNCQPCALIWSHEQGRRLGNGNRRGALTINAIAPEVRTAWQHGGV